MPPAQPEGKINTIDPDARRMKVGRDFIAAYNAQAAVTAQRIIVAAEITTEGGDFEQLDPVVTASERELHAAGVADASRSCSPLPATGPTTTSTRSEHGA